MDDASLAFPKATSTFKDPMSLISHESGCPLGAKNLLPAPDPNLNHHRGHFPQLSGDGLIYGGRLDQQPHPSPPHHLHEIHLPNQKKGHISD